MKRIVYFIIMTVMAFAMIGCASGKSDTKAAAATTPAAKTENAAAPAAKGKALVVYFSHVGENSGVGTITKGNTAIVAEMIAKKTGADLFEIVPEKAYPTVYRQTTAQAKQEQQENARPAIKGKVENMDQYDTVFIGYPIWWGDMPMPVFTFLDSYKFDNKRVIPFATHEGSGMGRSEGSLRSALSSAKVESGLAIRGRDAQSHDASVEKDVNEWLKGLNF